MLQRLDQLLASLGSRATEALSILARALTGEVRAGGSLARFVRTSRGKSDEVTEPSSLPLQSLHRQPLSIARYGHFRPTDSGTWVPGKDGPVANDYRKEQGLSRLRSSGRVHASLLTHIHRLNLDHRRRCANVRPTTLPVQDGGFTNHRSCVDLRCISLRPRSIVRDSFHFSLLMSSHT
jgi:hypothetical protein